MITEDYVSFETAKLLKEKGFDAECDYEYGVPVVEQGYVLQRFFKPIKNSELIDEAYAAPTLQMAMKWLREAHRIFIRVIQSHIEYCTCEIYYNSSSCYAFRTSFDSYEEACEEAIKYCLTNLI